MSNLISPGDWSRYTCYTWEEFWRANKSKYSLNAVQANKVLRRFAEKVHELILTNPEGVKFPFGTLFVAGNEMDAKDISKSTKEKRVEYRNIKTNRVVYTVRYIFGQTRGRVYNGFMWRFRTTVPLRKKIKQMIDQDNFRHWYIFDKYGDAPRLGVPAELIRTKQERKNANKTRGNKQT